MTQESAYPVDGTVRFKVESVAQARFALHLRIPEWAGKSATISINGVRAPHAVRGGSFATLERTWRAGDRVDLVLPMEMRLAAVDAETPGTVALMRGPLVLFPIGGGARTFHAAELLGARQTTGDEWLVTSAAGDVRFRPFASIGDEGYGTYVSLS